MKCYLNEGSYHRRPRRQHEPRQSSMKCYLNEGSYSRHGGDATRDRDSSMKCYLNEGSYEAGPNVALLCAAPQ